MNGNASWPIDTNDRPGGQKNRSATWPAEKAETSSAGLGDKLIEMLHGQQKRADTSSDRPGRHMNRNVAWPTGKGGRGHQQ